MRLSLSVQIALGLIVGLSLGLLTAATGSPFLLDIVGVLEPAGTIWINLVRMCVIPLVVTALVSGIAGLGSLRRVGRVGVRTFAFIFATIALASLTGLALALVLVPLAPVSAQTAEELRAAATAAAREVGQQTARIQGIRQFLVELVPANPVRAAADGALLPLIVFTVLLSAAIGSLADGPRRTVIELAEALVTALIKLIEWVMRLAPVGVACLAAPVTARLGWEAIRSLAVFVLTIVISTVLFATAVYGPSVRSLGRLALGQFGRAATPGATIAFTTASSMAALPAMLDNMIERLKLPVGVASFVLPLAATLNRPGSAVYQMAAVVFVGALYGVDIGAAQYAAAAVTCFLMTFSVAAVPSATVFTTAPVLAAAGLPVEAVALLLGVDRIPDMFRTGLNGIGHQTAAVVVARGEGVTFP